MLQDESQLSEIALKEKLLALAENDFHLSGGEDGTALIPAMLRHIGSTDTTLRDDLIYSAFYTWVVADRCLDREQMRFIAQTALDERHLFYGLGERETDSVFTRTFSVLLLPLVLFRHRAQPLFSPEEVLQIKGCLLRYLREEKDRRGFVEGKGWAHGAAHCADALDELAQCGELGAADHMEILQAIQSVVCCAEMIYSYGEEERLATAVVAAIGRQLLPAMELSGWIQAFTPAVLAVDATPQRLIIRSNVKNFLQSLFFRLQWAQNGEELLPSIQQTLYQINPYAKK